MLPAADDFEQQLSRLPPAGLPPQREAALLDALLNAERRATPWYRRSVPIWAAACLALFASGATLTLSNLLRTPAAQHSEPANPANSSAAVPLVFVDAPFRTASARERIQLTKWTVMNDRTIDPEGEKQ